MGLLNKDAIAGVVDTTFEVVEVPEWGGSVRVKSLTATERDAFEASLVAGEGKNRKANLANIRAKLVASCLVDEVGNRLFLDASAGASVLGAKNGAAMDRIFTVCQRLSGMSPADIAELEGNSGPDLSASSPSTSA